mmetsp:Transcript_15111/g.26771  ORF Transcript_15111/g.26771 Transcript_15111/m.26771 type:complete len:1057 (+) Transcript_15111:63-3233(+)
MGLAADLTLGPPASFGAEELRITWKSSLRIGGREEKKLKGLGRHPGRSQADPSLDGAIIQDGRRWKKAKASPTGYGGRTLREDKLGAKAELQEAFLDEVFENCPYNREYSKPPARRKPRRMQKSHSEPALRPSRQSPTHHSPTHHTLPSIQDGVKAARTALRRKPRHVTHHLPALKGPGLVFSENIPVRGPDPPKKALVSREEAPRQPLMELTLPPIGLDTASLVAQSICTPSQSKRPRSALRQISSTALSITAELDRAMLQLQQSEERSWADNTLTNVREREEADEVGSLHGASERLDAPSSPTSPTGRRSVLSSREGSLMMERQVSNLSRLSLVTLQEEWAEAPQESGMNEERMRAAFLHFVEPGTFDLSIQNLIELLRFVGHPVVSSTGSAVQLLVKEVTTYEYLDYDEFIIFMEKYAAYEKEHFHNVFKKFDADESGELDLSELRLLIKEVGIMTLNGMIKEAMSIVDVDCSGQLSFDEFLKFLRVYQRNEGFTAAEVKEISNIMDLVRSEDEGNKARAQEGILVDSLSDVLVRFFGIHCREDAQRLHKEIKDRHSLHNPHAPPNFQLRMSEVLLYARQLRERYYDQLKRQRKSGEPDAVQASSPKKAGQKSKLKPDRKNIVEFELYDSNSDGTISIDELRRALKSLEYEPMTVVLEEIFDEVLPEPGEAGRNLEFDEFFDFLLVYRQREGFLKSEVQSLKGVFHTFDEDNSGDVSGLELGDVFRYLGHSLSMDELKRFILIVDEDRSNELNFREFLRLMQLHRIDVIRQMRDIFSRFRESGMLPRSHLLAALSKCGHKDPPKEVILEISCEPMDFESFVHLADRLHRLKVGQERKRAGFSDTEIDKILEMFRRFDKDGSGDIDCDELQLVFREFGWAPSTAEEQEEIWGRLDRARALAREAGVEDTTEDGSACVKEWEFVQLARMIRRQQETADERAEARLAQSLKFSMPEVNEFREIFLFWLSKECEGSDDSEDEGETKKEVLTRETIRRLVRTMGVRFTTESKEMLDKELEHLGKGSITLDFQGFLHLMRWIIDTGFGGICTDEKPSLK